MFSEEDRRNIDKILEALDQHFMPKQTSYMNTADQMTSKHRECGHIELAKTLSLTKCCVIELC